MVEEETTSVVTRPNLGVMIGPYIWANSVSDSWSLSLSLNLLPTMGSGVGPGGSLDLPGLFLANRRSWMNTKIEETHNNRVE